jgi:glutaredoxin-related protein
MYGANWCPACRSLKADLGKRKIPYSFVDVDDPKQQKAGGDIPANQRGGIPVTRVTQRNGQVVWVKGADGARIEQAYRS